MTSPENTVPSVPAENVPRGTIFALIAIPAGVVVWCVLWSFGFVASIVALGVAYAALWLYRVGSGGRVGQAGAIRITIITVGTLLLAFFAGTVIDWMPAYAAHFGVTWVEALTSPVFWRYYNASVGANLGSYAISFLIALAFGALGCFGVLRAAFRHASAPPPVAGSASPQYSQPAPPSAGVEPPTPPTTPGQTTLNGPPSDPDDRS